MDIEVKEDEFRNIIESFDNEIKNLERIYKEVDTECKKIDGSDDIWKGKAQAMTYNYYKGVSVEFPDNIERLQSLSDYLKNTLENYINGENSINSDVDASGENLDVNSAQ